MVPVKDVHMNRIGVLFPIGVVDSFVFLNRFIYPELTLAYPVFVVYPAIVYN